MLIVSGSLEVWWSDGWTVCSSCRFLQYLYKQAQPTAQPPTTSIAVSTRRITKTDKRILPNMFPCKGDNSQVHQPDSSITLILTYVVRNGLATDARWLQQWILSNLIRLHWRGGSLYILQAETISSLAAPRSPTVNRGISQYNTLNSAQSAA